MKGLTWRITFVAITILFAAYLLIPSYLKFSTGKVVPKVPKDTDPWYYSVIPSEVLRLGLDLMGGLHLVLGIDFEEVHKDAASKLKIELTDMVAREKIEGVTFSVTETHQIVAHFTDESKWKKVDELIGTTFKNYIDFESQTATTATLKMSDLYTRDIRARAVDQSLETLRNRIDEFGIAEPIIQRQGEEKILVQFPGVSDTGRLKEIISRTARLSFQIVKAGPEEPSGPPTEKELADWVASFEKEKNVALSAQTPMSKYLRELNAHLKSKLPAGTEILFQKKTDINTRETKYTPYLVGSDALVTGEDLQDAYYSFDDENRPIVNFQLTPMGAIKFEKATGDNVGKYMAIVLDSNVHSAPRIKQRIGGGRAMIEMGSIGRPQQEILNDAKDTSLVLRSGALPARLEFLEERVIGPSLGADSIRSGTISLAVGVALVFGFMILYYKASGIVASFALGLNGLFVLAGMAAFEGTLTLPGLAGLTLGLGMSVDANVLIFEHMREELRSGKSLNLSIAEGFGRAFSAIFDGNVTTIIAALVLLSFGYGPIRGFAVTLLIGLIVSMYTAVFVTRVIFDYFIVSKNRTSISL